MVGSETWQRAIEFVEGNLGLPFVATHLRRGDWDTVCEKKKQHGDQEWESK